MSSLAVIPNDLTTIRYFRAPCDAADAADPSYGPGMWYAEFADGIARRQFEVYADHVLVAPYDVRYADQYESVLTDEHYEKIPLELFEHEWEQSASKRLREIAGLAS